MKIMLISILVIFLTSCGAATKPSSVTSSTAGANGTIRLIQIIPLPNVEGRIDHLSVDLKGQRLFVAALGNNTVEILDMSLGKSIHSISGLSEPQSVLFIPEFNKIFVADGGDGICKIFDAAAFTVIDQLDLSSDADNIRYDGNSKIVYVGHGNGGLSLIDAATDQILSEIKLDGHPESFQQEASGSKIFVNIPSVNQIAVVDHQKQKVIATWLMTSSIANYPMALDERQHRLFVGSRLPAKLTVYNSETGKLIASLDSVGDADDIFYDAAHKLIFVIGGEGNVDIFSQQDADHYQLVSRMPTASGARTGLWVPELNQLYVAVPHRGSQQAEIRIYELKP
jgi:DNA-binding beta-propeller fold protein YncE